MTHTNPAQPIVPPPPANLHILLEDEAAKVLRLAVRTLQRLRVDGGGPAYVQLSERRIGYTMAALEEWLSERARTSTSAPIGAGVAR